MDKILSQEEIDALMGGVMSGVKYNNYGNGSNLKLKNILFL